LDNDNRYTQLMQVYPKSWHSHIKQAFRMQCEDMIAELVTYSSNFKNQLILSV
jgi:hypothetical protein